MPFDAAYVGVRFLKNLAQKVIIAGQSRLKKFLGKHVVLLHVVLSEIDRRLLLEFSDLIRMFYENQGKIFLKFFFSNFTKKASRFILKKSFVAFSYHNF